jgi:hypothetical protein
VLDAAGPETRCALFFSHGMGPNYHGDHLFGELVARFDRMWSGEAPVPDAEDATSRGSVETLWRNTVGRIPDSWRDRVKRRIPLSVRMRISMSRGQDPAAWARAHSFALPMMDGFSAVRVNLVGREPEGRVRPGAEYDDHLDALESALLRVTNADTGEPAVERVVRTERVVDPMALGSGADLMVWWSKSAPLRAIHSPELGTVRAPWTDDRSGEHVMRGMFLLSDREARSGRRCMGGIGGIGGMQATDIAPTLCELGGVRPGASLTGVSRAADLLAPAALPR